MSRHNTSGGFTMKVAIASKGKELDSKICPEFNEAPDLIIYDLEKRIFDVEELTDKKNKDETKTDYIKYLVDNKIKSLITCRCDKKVFKKLNENGIKVYSANSSSIRTLVEKYKNKNLKELKIEDIQD
jgi:predicted Fe-Mo cluster-binding NifX family protein